MRYIPTPPTMEQLQALKQRLGDAYLGIFQPNPEAQPQLIVALRYPTRDEMRRFRAYKADESMRAKAEEILAAPCIVWPEAQPDKDRLFDAYPAIDTSVAGRLILASGGNPNGAATPIDEAALARLFRSGEG